MDGGLEWVISDYIVSKITQIHQKLSNSQKQLPFEILKIGHATGRRPVFFRNSSKYVYIILKVFLTLFKVFLKYVYFSLKICLVRVYIMFKVCLKYAYIIFKVFLNHVYITFKVFLKGVPHYC